MARPKLPPEQRPVSQTVRLPPDVADAVCRMALRRGVSVYSLLGGIIERVFEKQKTRQMPESCYSQPSSTLSTVLEASRNAAPTTRR